MQCIHLEASIGDGISSQQPACRLGCVARRDGLAISGPSAAVVSAGRRTIHYCRRKRVISASSSNRSRCGAHPFVWQCCSATQPVASQPRVDTSPRHLQSSSAPCICFEPIYVFHSSTLVSDTIIPALSVPGHRLVNIYLDSVCMGTGCFGPRQRFVFAEYPVSSAFASETA